MGEFQYHKQETNYTCGAAAMRMALENCGVKRTENQIVKLLSTNKVRGTWIRSFPPVAERFKLCHVSMRNSSIEEIKHYIKLGYAVIVCYFYPPEKVDHYSVVKMIDDKYIYFWDPFFGESHRYTLTYFNRIWKSDPRYEDEKRWFFAVKR